MFHAVTCQLEINQARTGKLVDQKVTTVQGVSPSLIDSLESLPIICRSIVPPVLVVYLLLF